MLEIEVKLPIENLSAVRTQLETLGWTRGERLLERNTVYDAPDRALDRAGKLLRIRESGDRALLTVKLPAQSDGPHKVREEHNLEGPGPTLERIVEGLGFASAWRYEKYRTRYRKAGEEGVIELDETPVGNYLELEGAPEWIDATAAALGFSSENYVTDTYRELFVTWQGRQIEPPRDMVFAG
ncbi:MAG: class IV adenylate cyclase [Bryobacterales bacterium]|nr:class IV adenylate cyclase [Bryobacterales bacterium]